MVEFNYLGEDVIRYILVLLYLCIINYESVLGIYAIYIYTFITLRKRRSKRTNEGKERILVLIFTFSIIP